MADVVLGAWERLADWLWAVLAVVFGWAWRLSDRVTRLEMQHASTTESLRSIAGDVKHIDEKIDKLVDKLT